MNGLNRVTDILKILCNADGVAGYEDEVRGAIEEMVRPYADEMITDALGNLLVFKKGKKARNKPLVVCAHMDEVGFMVREITEKGMLKFVTVGSVDLQRRYAHRRLRDDRSLRHAHPRASDRPLAAFFLRF